MARIKRISTAFAVGLSLALLSLGQFGTIRASDGRDFPRCVQSCNESRTTCKSQCVTDCEALYPEDVDAQATCNLDCDTDCLANSQECKSTCQSIKEPPSDQEP
jgi:hypothetical protein